ncbi:GPI anchored protein [Aspergillus luchuensis]|uniref:GPI anchored protein n=1 Tax=Aspergillus kawachii TaxID=1069201 RepID=A0A146FWI5_ASPKA|nr:GPI anchored protein [Aspergillus luchuensis IFO 4308]GAT29253.1 GPI anchored protein [Aspergillus luchuensis]
MLSIPLLACILGPSIAGQALASNVSIPNDSQDTDSIVQHNALIESYLSQKPVRGVHKMTDDEGEKFFLDYWLFDEAYTTSNTSNVSDSSSQAQPYGLDTTEKVDLQPRSYPFRPSYPSDLEVERRGWSEHFSPLLRREFKCPSGTYGCSSIDRPESCCSTSDTCVLVNDTGSGDDGYSSCSSSLGGGCCIPGYECVTGGCMRVFTITITVSSTVMLSTSTHTIPKTTATQTTGDLVPPSRPTTVSTSTNSKTTTTTSTASVCPTGFYACSAVYHGGCCRTGRDCDTTSCPATPSTTLTSDGVTIVVPVATTTASTTTTSTPGRCATGWFSCAQSVGGGCCPSGYQCGASCTAVSTATETVAKEQATSGSDQLRQQWGVMGMGMMVALAL